ncbi:hypothetical protein TSTA_009820 [Talaromyces stipitatus ATCC 10500]|uniref:Uncharacterized protein n=1 Tax=Talaromyces stipitatus (strain ATCC 10500 / CBS 375.48 / QM 6759 / NRRL 1006) TaxID=441959 RepID=B8MFZ7_TALSN|nr:uncharacterized protein TSTA_009820 [Talaromyces stipitatus ATCC 10500]EED15864.1 hypothetical protein TSTA_009820 [Talaromyces stipitatus ATCC 10500]
MNKHIKGVNCRKSLTKRPNIKQLLENASQAPARPMVSTQESWEPKLLKLLTTSRFPFQFIEYPKFYDAFMAITGYFIDEAWEYQEILLSFNPFLDHTLVSN